jgi:hypothetical protein
MLEWLKEKVEPVHVLSALSLGVVSALAFLGNLTGTETLAFISGAVLGAGSVVARARK